MNSEVEAGSVAAEPAQTELKRFRIYPVFVLLLAMIATWLAPSFVDDGPPMLWMSSAFGPVSCGVLILIWFVTFSRASGLERIIGFFGVVSSFGITFVSLHETMVGAALILVTVPVGMAAFGIGAIALGRARTVSRTFILVVIAAAGFGSSALLRADGMWGNFNLGLHWRWELSAEDRLMANYGDRSSVDLHQFAESDVEAWLENPEWPSFRGADGAVSVQGIVIAEDWTQNPPRELWKTGVGPGWSSFAVAGKLLFTQEQRGPNETVVCYDADTGAEIWNCEIDSRFSDPLGGPGPRATPTLSAGGLFVQGANGQVMRLDPRSGDIVWQKDLRELADREPPAWGFSSSPLGAGDLVVVWAGGQDEKGVFAFDMHTGDVRWSAAAGNHTYSSPQFCSLNGDDVIAMLTNKGVNLLDPASGAARLNYDWPHDGYRAVQPHVVDGNSLLLPSGIGGGTRRIEVSGSGHELQAREQWTSRQLKPDFNDFVVDAGFAYGFDGAIMTCIDLNTGKRRWKRGRYGKGQVLLLKESGLLLVLGEYGDIVLLRADPSTHQALGKMNVLDGKTWNHPVVTGNRLYIRNAQEASCWILPTTQMESVLTTGR